MNVTIAAATRFEVKEEYLRKSALHHIDFLYTGVGMLSTAVSLMQYLFQHKPHLIIQAGIAGSFDTSILLGDVAITEKEYAGDIGVWENEEWKDVFDMNFQQANEAPYYDKSLLNPWLKKYNVLQLPLVTGITVNEITTSIKRVEILKTKYKGQIETMEGASLHYVCRLQNVPFIQARAVSNYVGERDKTKWKIKEAIENVNEAVKKMLALLP